MKLAFLCSSPSWGGLEINNLKLCGWLKERGHEPILLCQVQSRLGREAIQNKIQVVEFDHRRKHIAFRPAVHLSRILHQHQINILIIGHYRHFYLCVWAKVFSPTPLQLVYWQQMQIVLKRKDIYHAFFYKKLDAWIAPLQYLKSQLLANTVLSENKIHVIPLGVDLSLFKNTVRQKEDARQQFGLPSHDFLVGTIGRIDKEKGQENLLYAIRKLKDKNIRIQAVLIGEETIGGEGYLSVLHELAKRLDLENEVFFKPFTRDVTQAFACLDIFVMASLSEPIGMVTVEAMAAGVPVIGTHRGGTPELLANGEAGLLYEPTDSAQLADHILYLYQNHGARTEFIRKALQRTHLYSHELECKLLEVLISAL